MVIVKIKLLIPLKVKLGRFSMSILVGRVLMLLSSRRRIWKRLLWRRLWIVVLIVTLTRIKFLRVTKIHFLLNGDGNTLVTHSVTYKVLPMGLGYMIGICPHH